MGAGGERGQLIAQCLMFRCCILWLVLMCVWDCFKLLIFFSGDGRPAKDSVLKRSFSIDKLPALSKVKDDLTVLRHMWFSKQKGGDHASRLENFYGPQAQACELDKRAKKMSGGYIKRYRNEPHCCLLVQTTSSVPTFCGDASPCSLLALLAWRAART